MSDKNAPLGTETRARHNGAPPAAQLDAAAADMPGANLHDGARKRRDPNEPVAVVGLGASAGGVSVLQQFFADMQVDSGLAFVVVMHLSPEHESSLASILQQHTAMPVLQVTHRVKVKPNHAYVIPPNNQLAFDDGMLELLERPPPNGRPVTIDLFFRSLAHSFGQRAVGVILSGSDSDGVIGLKHIRAQGGVTIAQDPDEAEHNAMPLTAISTGMVDWVLPVAEIPPKLVHFVRNEHAMKLPPEIPDAPERDAKLKDAPGGETVSDETRSRTDENAIMEVLAHLRAQTGHDFTHYKRATILRRIARRMQVNLVESIPDYLGFLRRHSDEPLALLQDLLIGVTHFFRDQDAFAALEANIPQLFSGKTKDDQVRAWVAGCATGEEAYSVAMLLTEYAERFESPPIVQVFATDIDEQSLLEAREGLYPHTIEADISQDRLRHFFSKDQGRYRVRKHLREKVLFAAHNFLRDAPFSRIDLISCRNLLIYLGSKAQEQAFEVFHFSLRSAGLLFLGGSETSAGHALFSPVDTNHRIYARRSVPRPVWKIPVVPVSVPLQEPPARALPKAALPPLTQATVQDAGRRSEASDTLSLERRGALFGELHLRLLEQYAPPSVVVNAEHEVVHLSVNAGAYLRFTAGEPSANIFKLVRPELQVELRTALFSAGQNRDQNVRSSPQTVHFDSHDEVVALHVRRVETNQGEHFFLVLFQRQDEPGAAAENQLLQADVARGLDEEIAFLKAQLATAVEQYEATNEELKASNEELQAINEEMRSATEELQTSKEELQSGNEELTTVNAELKNSVEELSRANADLNNLMGSTDIGTIFLNRQLRVHRFTPSAQKIFNLLPTDIGRPLADITHHIDYDALMSDVEDVLDRLTTIEREVARDRPDGGEEEARWYLVRIAPYRALQDRIAGVVVTFIDITRRHRAEDAVRESEERMARLADAIPQIVWTNTVDGTANYFNRRWYDYTGLTFEKSAGPGWQAVVHPDDAPASRDRWQKALKAGEVFDSEYRLRNADGDYRWFIGRNVPLRDKENRITGWFGTATDIHDLKLAEASTREMEGRFQLLVEGTPDYAMFLLDPENVITFWSTGAEKVFGWTAEEAVGQTGAIIFTDADQKKGEVEKEIETAVREGRAPDRRWHRRKDGSRLWADGVMRRIDRRDGGLRGFAKICRDATEQREIEDALLHAKEEMEQRVIERTREVVATNNELERTMAQRRQLERELLEISEREKRRIGEDLHDMVCQELTATALYLKSTAKKLARKDEAAAQTLEESAETVNRNVGIARELARGLQAVELRAAGLKDALRDLAASANQNRGVNCHFKAARGVRVTDDAVALHLYRIAQEAVTNALKHSGAHNILIALDRSATHICVSVQDDGKGFDLGKRRKGLGVHMMRYRANALEGELSIERRKTGGMDITCKIPIKR
ncbi:MAG TPA: chemotaxis protein CheB [Chthoniobacterales bacterium]|nr:chemotaxis protein CheB [Chthoniobacterales bacterium]